MSKIKQVKLPVQINEHNELELQGWQKEILSRMKYNWKLVREGDNLTKQSEKIMWIEFDENGMGKSKHDEPSIGRSLIMSPFNDFFTWQTTTITEIIEEKEDYVKFKTQNSNYELFKLKDGE